MFLFIGRLQGHPEGGLSCATGQSPRGSEADDAQVVHETEEEEAEGLPRAFILPASAVSAAATEEVQAEAERR